MLKVKAVKLGFFNGQRVRPGQVFFIEEKQLSKIWMEVLTVPNGDQLEDVQKHSRQVEEMVLQEILPEKQKKVNKTRVSDEAVI